MHTHTHVHTTAHGDPSTSEPIDDDVRRFMETLSAERQHLKTRPWEGR